jgi:hypothetical protein
VRSKERLGTLLSKNRVAFFEKRDMNIALSSFLKEKFWQQRCENSKAVQSKLDTAAVFCPMNYRQLPLYRTHSHTQNSHISLWAAVSSSDCTYEHFQPIIHNTTTVVYNPLGDIHPIHVGCVCVCVCPGSVCVCVCVCVRE